MLTRIKMYLLLWKLTAICDNTGDEWIDLYEYDSLQFTPKQLSLLRALEKLGAVELDFGDDSLGLIHVTPGATLYQVERAELWTNRIVSFLAGIFSTLIVEFIIRNYPLIVAFFTQKPLP